MAQGLQSSGLLCMCTSCAACGIIVPVHAVSAVFIIVHTGVFITSISDLIFGVLHILVRPFQICSI